jgi:tetratricopeptide (TPR) repeat protein
MSGLACRLVCCALALLAAGSVSGQHARDVPRYSAATQGKFLEAERLFRSANYAASLALYEELAERYPEAPPAHVGLAASASRLGDHAQAADAYLAAVHLLPEDATLEGELADSSRSAKRYVDAEKWYRRAIADETTGEGRTRWHVGLGLIDSDAGRFAEAVAHYRDALVEDPDSSVARHDLGVALLNMNDLVEADAAFVRVLVSDPSNARALFARGKIAARNGDRGRAADLYSAAAELEPDEPTFHHAHGQTLRRLGDWDGAAAALNRYRATKAALYRAKGRDAMAKGRWVDAQASFTKAVETDPQDIDSLADRAYCLLKSGESENARRGYEAVLAARPDSPRAMYHLGVALYHLGRHDDAEDRLLDLIDRSPDFPESYRQLAWVRRAKGDITGAEGAFSMGLARNDKWAPGYWWRGGVRRQLGDEVGAEADLRRSIQLTPDAPFPRESLARLLLETGGDLDEALAHAQVAATKTPSPMHRTTLALVYHALGRSDDATREIQRAYGDAPSDTRVLTARRLITGGVK